MHLAELGWNDFFAKGMAASPAKNLEPARVALVFRGGYEVWAESGEYLAQVSGRFRHFARSKADNPVTGDFALIESVPSESKALIHAILPRRTTLSRTGAGRSTEEQILATNVDFVFIAASLAGPFRARTLERYLSVARDSGAQPILLLTKTDLCENVAEALAAANEVATDAPVIPVSSISRIGLAEVRRLFTRGCTAVILGPSGVGKSTLINALCGDELLPTAPVRDDDQKGRHTTTERELIVLPKGGLIIDTPGLRELQLWEGAEGIADAFADISELATSCRFTNCQHNAEPGCAVRDAVRTGALPEDRLLGFQKLKRESLHFESRHDYRIKADERRRSKQLTKELRTRLREKGRDDT